MIKSVNRRTLRNNSLAGILAAAISTGALADDIDVYTIKQKPNVLFVLDYSGSMGSLTGGNRSMTRMAALKSVMQTVLNDNVNDINAGLGSLYNGTTTGIRWPISELSADASTIDPSIPVGSRTVKDIILGEVNSRGAGGGTATVDAMVEAAQYFRGDPVTHNDLDINQITGHRPHTWNLSTGSYSGGRNSAAIAVTYSPSNAWISPTEVQQQSPYYCNNYSSNGGPNYCIGKSIITSSCQLRSPSDRLTTGYERLENLWGSYTRCEYNRTRTWIGARYNSPITKSCQSNNIILITDGDPSSFSTDDSLRSIVGDPGRCSASYGSGSRCATDIARILSTTDQMTEVPGSRVKTHTVGFNIGGNGQRFLQSIALAGQGQFFNATDVDDLSNALSSILNDVTRNSESFVEFSIDINKRTFSTDNRAYFSLFSPSERRSWNGNLKGYFVDNTGLIDIYGNPATEDIGAGEQFTQTAHSFWSSTADGNNVEKGGASSKLLTGTRTLYTYTGNAIPANGISLATDNRYRLRRNNTAITTQMVGASSSAQRNSALDWIQNAPMGDPLHTKSVLVDYGNRQVTYLSTNQGLLHAIDTTSPATPGAGDRSGGAELFAFMPKRLLSNLPALQENRNMGPHIYGLDGQITRWHEDSNNDGIVNNGESMMLVFGMRRGGNAYYALDVSNPTSPRLLWMIDTNKTGFSRLAQTWSRMSLITVLDGGVSRRVLAFAGGYDASVLDPRHQPTASSGNAIYMVNQSGELEWRANSSNHASMRYSIPSDLTIIDSDQDGNADRLYVGDTGGQVWRVDFEDISVSPIVTRLANLQDGMHQPFFYPPSVAFNPSPSGDFLSVSLGSGNRTAPLREQAQNYLYMIRDTNVAKGRPPSNFNTITTNQLYDATQNNISSSNARIARAAQQALDNAQGWKVALKPSEKALSELITFEGKVLATTFEPSSDIDANSCKVETTGRLYTMNVLNATPVKTLGSTTSTDSNQPARRTYELQSTGIPSSPVPVFSSGSNKVQIFVDKEETASIEQGLSTVFWHAK